MLGQPAQTAVHGLNSVGGVDDLSNLWGVVEEGGDLDPVAPPGLPYGQVNGLAPDRALAHFDLKAIEREDRIDRVQRTGLLHLDLFGHRIRDRRNQARGDLGPIHLLQMTLDLSHRESPGIQGEDLWLNSRQRVRYLGTRWGSKVL